MRRTTAARALSTRATSMRPIVVAAAAALTLVGCGGSDEGTGQPPPAAVFAPAVHRIVLEVDYVATAEPYTGRAGALANVWDLTRSNLAALFATDQKQIVIPETLTDMQRISSPAGPYTGADLASIAAAHRNDHSTADTATFYAVWLDGFYATAAGVDETVLGAALPDYGVIGIFKPVLRRLERPLAPGVAPFTEQSALVHELGHALGLVNTGLPMSTPHEDPSHPGHCTATTCVMYWSNEGGRSLYRFASDLVQTGSAVLFDEACLERRTVWFQGKSRSLRQTAIDHFQVHDGCGSTEIEEVLAHAEVASTTPLLAAHMGEAMFHGDALA